MIWLVAVVGCGRIKFDPQGDAGIAPRCNPQAPFTSISPIASLNSGATDGGARLSDDETVVYFHSSSLNSNFQILTARRASRDLPFETPTVAVASTIVYWPTVTPDQLTLVYSNSVDLQSTTRGATTDVFPAGTTIASLEMLPNQNNPYLAAGGTKLYFVRYAPDGKLIQAPWPPTGATQVITELDAGGDDHDPTVSDDELVMYFARNVGGQGDIFMAQRDTATSSFGAAAPVAELNTAANDGPTWLSPDLCRLYFESNRTDPSFDIYVAERQP